jgi:hypothetical protein
VCYADGVDAGGDQKSQPSSLSQERITGLQKHFVGIQICRTLMLEGVARVRISERIVLSHPSVLRDCSSVDAKNSLPGIKFMTGSRCGVSKSCYCGILHTIVPQIVPEIQSSFTDKFQI